MKKTVLNYVMAFLIAIVSSATTAIIFKSNFTSDNSQNKMSSKSNGKTSSLMPDLDKKCLSQDTWSQGIYQVVTNYSDYSKQETYLSDSVDVTVYVYDGAIAIDFRCKAELNYESDDSNSRITYKLKTKEDKAVEINAKYEECCVYNKDASHSNIGNTNFGDFFFDTDLPTLKKGDLISRYVFDIPDDILEIDPDFQMTVFGHDVDYCKIKKKKLWR